MLSQKQTTPESVASLEKTLPELDVVVLHEKVSVSLF